MDRRVVRQADHKVQGAADGLHVAAQGRQVHVGLLLDLRDRGLADVHAAGDLRLGLAGEAAQLAQALELLPQLPVPRPHPLLPLPRQLRHDLVEAAAHETILS